MNYKGLNALKTLLVVLITSLTITGISIIDDKIWNIIIAIIGVAAYGIVGFLYSIHLLSNSREGKYAYLATFIILIIIGFFVYQGIVKFEQWIVSWPLFVKILVPSILVAGIAAVITFIVKNKKKVPLEKEEVN